MAKTTQPETPESEVIAVRRSTDLAMLDELDRILLGGDFNAEIVDDPALISVQIIRELLAAETDDDLEFVGAAQGWSELEGIPVEIQGFRWRPSQFAKEGETEPSGIYLVVFGNRMDDGEAVVLTTGSLNVVAQLSNLARRGRLPGVVRILTRSDKPSSAGFYPMRLVSTAEEIESRKAERVAARQATAPAPGA